MFNKSRNENFGLVPFVSCHIFSISPWINIVSIIITHTWIWPLVYNVPSWCRYYLLTCIFSKLTYFLLSQIKWFILLDINLRQARISPHRESFVARRIIFSSTLIKLFVSLLPDIRILINIGQWISNGMMQLLFTFLIWHFIRKIITSPIYQIHHGFFFSHYIVQITLLNSWTGLHGIYVFIVIFIHVLWPKSVILSTFSNYWGTIFMYEHVAISIHRRQKKLFDINFWRQSACCSRLTIILYISVILRLFDGTSL